MGYLRGDFIGGSVINGSGNPGATDIPTLSLLEVTINVTNVTGTLTAANFWLEASDDGGNTWFAVAYDQQLTHTITATDPTANVNGRNINGTSSITPTTLLTSTKWTAVYKHLPAGMVRLAYVITGTFTAGQGLTTKATWQGK